MNRIGLALALLPMVYAGSWAQTGTPPHPDADGVYPVINGVHPARLIEGVPARFSDKLHGSRRICAVKVVITKEGKPVNPQIVNKDRSPFDDAAIAAVMESTFQAGGYNATPLSTSQLVLVPFLANDPRAVPVIPWPGAASNPTALKTPEARFPKGAPPGVYQVMCLVQLVVREDGRPSQTRVLIPIGKGFDEQALDAVNHYRFSPAMFEGVPVPALITVEIKFKTF